VLEDCKFASIDEQAFVREVHQRALSLSKRIGTFRLVEGRRFTPFRYDRTSRAPVKRPAADENGQVAAGEATEAVAAPATEPDRV